MFLTTRQDRTIVGIINTVLFAALSFLYLYFYQDGLLYAALFLLSNGAIEYQQTLGAIIITALLLLVHAGFSRLYKPAARSSALTFIPEIIILTLLTGFDITAKNTLQYDKTLPICIVTALIFVGIMVYLSLSIRLDEDNTETPSLIKSIWKNLLFMFFLFMFLCLFANNDKSLHIQIRIEQQLKKNDYSNALSTIKTLSKPNGCTTMLTMYALSCEGVLAEKLFEYPIAVGSQNVLPKDGGSRTIFFPEEKILSRLGMSKSSMKSGKIDSTNTIERLSKSDSTATKNDALTDYLLCSYLLDRDLDNFVDAFAARKSTDLEVPKHYQEALILYARTRSNPKIVFRNSIVETDFQDFQRMEKDIEDPTVRQNRLRDVYGNTYWYYFVAR